MFSLKAVILAGGFGTRLSEETVARPKPMVEIGGFPILWHIMKIYSHWGVNDFVICCGYKGYSIKEYFLNYAAHNSDLTIDLCEGATTIHKNRVEPWKITLVDTGESTMTGGRLGRVRQYVEDEECFFLTYGDGVADINIRATYDLHTRHGKLATLTAVRPPGRFGALEVSGTTIKSFTEKPLGDGGRINGGFFVLSPGVLDLIGADSTIWEQEPLQTLAEQGELQCYVHDGFWQPMDTLRDKHHLEDLWSTGNAPWKLW